MHYAFGKDRRRCAPRPAVFDSSFHQQIKRERVFDGPRPILVCDSRAPTLGSCFSDFVHAPAASAVITVSLVATVEAKS